MFSHIDNIFNDTLSPSDLISPTRKKCDIFYDYLQPSVKQHRNTSQKHLFFHLFLFYLIFCFCFHCLHMSHIKVWISLPFWWKLVICLFFKTMCKWYWRIKDLCGDWEMSAISRVFKDCNIAHSNSLLSYQYLYTLQYFDPQFNNFFLVWFSFAKVMYYE